MLEFLFGIIDFAKDLVDMLKDLTEVTIEIVDTIFIFVPSPFKEMTLTFVGFASAIILYKLVRKG